MGSMLSIDPTSVPFPCLIGGRPVNRDEVILVRSRSRGGDRRRAGLDEGRVLEALASASSAPRLSRHERNQVLLRARPPSGAGAGAGGPAHHLEIGALPQGHGRCMRCRARSTCCASPRAEALRDDGQCLAFDVSPGGRNRRGFTLREPLSLVTAITPPSTTLSTRLLDKVAPAIAVGTPMVLKPSERRRSARLYLAPSCTSRGLPPGALNVITGDPEVLGPLAGWTPRGRAGEGFTGGVEIGKRIARMLGYRRAVLELGGNDPARGDPRRRRSRRGREARGAPAASATAGSAAPRSSASSSSIASPTRSPRASPRPPRLTVGDPLTTRPTWAP